jgi:hypothetical protein
MRASEEFFLRCINLLNSIFPNDLLRGVIWIAIINANIYHLLDNPELGDAYAGEDTPPPDSERRPVSRAAIAQSLGLPLETCRRHINQMVHDGLCVEVEGGVIVPATRLSSPQANQANQQNMVNLRRFLQRLGVKGEI